MCHNAGMEVLTVPALRDNYAYLLVHGREAVAVDPAEAAPVRDVLAARGLTLSAIWCTHHHADHTGGVRELAAPCVYGSAYDLAHGRIEGQTHALDERSCLRIGDHPVRVLEVPGHTLGSIAFLAGGALFTGDTLFLAGCGRLFEGTMEQLAAALAKLDSLPAETLVYGGHEYAQQNLAFAAAMAPGDAAILERARVVAERCERGEPAVPGTLGEERASNLFLRSCRDLAAFTRLRQAKDSWSFQPGGGSPSLPVR